MTLRSAGRAAAYNCCASTSSTVARAVTAVTRARAALLPVFTGFR
jgi:hypothetical protein